MPALLISMFQHPKHIPASRTRGSLSHLLPPALLALLLLALITGVNFRIVQRFDSDNRWITHTHMVLAQLADLRSDIQDTEVEQRGYLLSGDTRMRAAFEGSVLAVDRDLTALRHVTQDNPIQQKNLDIIRPIADRWRTHLESAAVLKGANHVLPFSALPRESSVAAADEPVRRMTDRMAHEEFRLLLTRVSAAESAGRTAHTLVLAGAGVVVVLLLLGILMTGQYQRERVHVEAALLVSQQDLELRVAERTQALEDAGQTLQEREQKFRFLADSMPQIVWITRPDGVADFYNQRWHEYTGLSREETDNGGVQAVVHPDDMKAIAVSWLDAMTKGQPYTMEYRLKRADGRYLWHLGRVVPQRDASGEIVLWVGTGTDVDEYKQVAAALQKSHEELEHRVTERTIDLEKARDRVLESEAQFRSAIDAMQEGLLVQDRNKKVLLCNGMAEAILGASPGMLTGNNAMQPHWDLISEDGSDFDLEAYPSRLAMQSGQRQTSVIMGLRRKDGSLTWLSVNAAPLFHIGQSEPYAAVTTFSDITDRRHSEEAIRQAEEKYRGIFENSLEGLFQSTPSGKLLNANPASARMLGYESPQSMISEMTDITNQVYSNPADRERVIEQIQTQSSITGMELQLRRRDGNVFWASLNAHTQRDEEGRILFLEGSIQDITQRRADDQSRQDYSFILQFQKAELEKTVEELARVNDQLEALATLDGLTGLKNHRAFQERLADEFKLARRYSQPLSVVMLDVDKFKDYNDAHGHPAGDEILREVARILEESIRDCDFAARYGGEEFVLILPQTDSEGATVISERCRAAIERHSWPHRQITASFGVASLVVSETGTEDSSALLTEADDFLYVAKANGRNQIVCSRVLPVVKPRQGRRRELDLSL